MMVKIGQNNNMKRVADGQQEWHDQRVWLYTKSLNTRSFIQRVRQAFDLYMTYSVLNRGYHSVTELYVDILSDYGIKMDRRVLCRIVKDGFEAQYMFKNNNQYRLTPPGRRANWQMRNVLKRLDKEKDGFGYETLFDIVS